MHRFARSAAAVALLAAAGALSTPAHASGVITPSACTAYTTGGYAGRCDFNPNGVEGTITVQPPPSGPASASVFCDGTWTGYSAISQNGVPKSVTYPESPSWKACYVSIYSPGVASATAN